MNIQNKTEEEYFGNYQVSTIVKLLESIAE